MKKYKNNIFNQFPRFLTENEFPDEVSAQTLKSPATNYVKNIFLFIFNKFNENLTDFNSFEDDVKVFLNLYGFESILVNSIGNDYYYNIFLDFFNIKIKKALKQ